MRGLMDVERTVADTQQDLKQIKKMLEISNIIRLAELRFAAGQAGKHLINGAEMDEEEFYDIIQKCWDECVK